uniref:Uncharacterized protein n=1 Tax=Rhizophora mucronata TaxID=61149 RepID=A0A2P2NL92_RHIMU
MSLAPNVEEHGCPAAPPEPMNIINMLELQRAWEPLASSPVKKASLASGSQSSFPYGEVALNQGNQ